MKASVAAKLASLVSRAKELDALLSDPDVTSNLDNYRKLTREHAEIAPVVGRYGDYVSAEGDVAAAEDMAKDPQMREFAESEIRAGRERLEEIAADIQKMLLPKDPNDEKNLFLEIRAGTGGDESALFAGDLFRMYTRFAERNRWQVEVISESLGDAGGYKEVIARIVGQGAYSRLKFESGGHRVQRVPATETQGRIHTSAATVAVMPEADDASDVVVNPADVRVDTFRASGVEINPADVRVDTYRASGAGASVPVSRVGLAGGRHEAVVVGLDRGRSCDLGLSSARAEAWQARRWISRIAPDPARTWLASPGQTPYALRPSVPPAGSPTQDRPQTCRPPEPAVPEVEPPWTSPSRKRVST